MGRLALTVQGQVRYTLKTPYRNGTTHVLFEPLDFIARLAALVPRPRVHLTRYHGILAPHSGWRAAIVPAGRGPQIAPDQQSPAERHRALTWAQRLKRVFRIDIETCERCGGRVRIIASIEDPAVSRISTLPDAGARTRQAWCCPQPGVRCEIGGQWDRFRRTIPLSPATRSRMPPTKTAG
jgi:hypothetical protein